MANKSESDWKPIEIDPQFFSDKEFRNLVCIEEVTDYKIVNGQIILGSESIEQAPKRKLTQNSSQKKKRKRAKLRKNADVSEKKLLSDKNSTEPSKTKGQAHSTTASLPDMGAWAHLPVPEPVLQAIAEQGFTQPTPIQNECLIPAIEYKQDIVGAAATGSGKTLAFGIPILYNIMEDEKIKASKSKKLETDNENNESSLAPENENEGKSNDENETLKKDNDSQNVEINVMATDRELLEDEVEDEDDEDGVFKNFEDSQISDEDGLKALILTPTRELAVQVKNHLVAVAKYTKIKVVAIIGGMSEQRQERILKRRPHIIVATPGRLWELYNKRNPYILTVKSIQYLVIDEADRMVEKGHFEELQKLLSILRHFTKMTQKRRQTFLFSATLTLAHMGPQRKLSRKFQANLLTTEGKIRMMMYKMGLKKGAKMVDLTEKTRTAEKLSEAKVLCEREKKDVYLYYFLKQHPGRTLVFCNSKDSIRRLVSIFTLLECHPLPLHSDMHQKQRLRNLERFSSSPNALLLATDIAARGLDIPKIDHVIHFQVPHTMENYIHRSGRTARASEEGLTVLLISPEEQKGYRKILFSLDRTKDFDQFPVDNSYIPAINVRMQLALKIDSEEHRFDKKKHENNWFRKTAEEMDIELDEDNLYDLGDSRDQANLRHKIASMKMQLQTMLKTKLVSKKLVTKYPTKMGKLRDPMEISNSSSSAISELQNQKLLMKDKKKQKKKIVIKDVNELKKNNLIEKKRQKAMRRKKRKELLMKQFSE
ncbi:ATP-dependent RNA helicase DDX24 [Octopus sinensis]|uniref:RNA helicase n=1 Tax=Octopus sinensis TaxID=2607531 RepID=A0A6P7SNC8_9MOLL|nr:ATP-dependent RNA helicase DDX24 [Octopus sinensis]